MGPDAAALAVAVRTVNTFLIPYTWLRHLAMSIWCAGAGLLAWWVVLSLILVIGPFWTIDWDGAVLLMVIAGFVGGSNTLGETCLRRQPIHSRLWRTLTAAGISGGVTVGGYWLTRGIEAAIFFGGSSDDVGDATLVTLRYRLGSFVVAGLGAALGPLVVRKFKGAVDHLGAGLAAGLAGAAAWHAMNHVFGTDLYGAGAALGLAFGGTFGLLAWGLPDELYAGWLRLLSQTRFAHRIPVDAPEGGPKERFVGHFPRGLDLFMPAQEGVLEMHLSVAVDQEQRYSARGLTLAPTVVQRFLEKVDIRYDPRRPAPLQTRLRSGDRIVLGEGPNQGVVEFVMLPREEQ